MRTLVAVVLLATASAAPSARAQEEASTGAADAEARRHFDVARRAYDVGDWPLAVREFEVAYRLSRLPDILYNIYSAAERGGMWERAASALATYLAEGEPGARRTDLEARLARLRARVEAEPGEGAAQRDAEGGRASPVPPRDGGLSLHPAALGLLLGSGALLASFGVFAALAALEDGSLAAECGASCSPSRAQALEVFTLVADISWITAAVAGAAGLVLVLLLPADDDAARSTGEASGVLRLAPWASEGGAGLVVSGAF